VDITQKTKIKLPNNPAITFWVYISTENKDSMRDHVYSGNIHANLRYGGLEVWLK
jgi:hypothetical protein